VLSGNYPIEEEASEFAGPAFGKSYSARMGSFLPCVPGIFLTLCAEKALTCKNLQDLETHPEHFDVSLGSAAAAFSSINRSHWEFDLTHACAHAQGVWPSTRCLISGSKVRVLVRPPNLQMTLYIYVGYLPMVDLPATSCTRCVPK
jgi:hypothetical protein